MKTLFLSLILTLVFGTALAANAQTSQQVTLRLNRQTSVMRNKLTIKFISVEDSRCPQDVDCIWAGNAKVTVKLTNSRGKSQTLVLNSNINPRAVKFEGYEIELGGVTPTRRSNVRVNKNGYSASFTVTKL